MTPASVALPWLRRLDPERAHRLAILALRLGLGGRNAMPDHPALRTCVLGRVWQNPIGLAAGFDKNAVAVRGLRRLGFGFVEVGTVTPRPQQGNPRPRVFRLDADRAVINRYGLNNHGLAEYVAHLAAIPPGPVLVGANVGINKDRADPERDYPALVAAVAPHADYVAINVSSPNTPGLRDLQHEARLSAILAAIGEAVPARPPLFVKLAPDLADAALEAIVEAAVTHGADGLIIGNTTTARPSLRSPHAPETGGLSGPPLFARSTEMLARAHRLASGRLVLIGCGGVCSGRDVLAKLRAGADLVQLYTAFSFEGPALLPRIKAELLDALREQGLASVSEAVAAGR